MVVSYGVDMINNSKVADCIKEKCLEWAQQAAGSLTSVWSHGHERQKNELWDPHHPNTVKTVAIVPAVIVSRYVFHTKNKVDVCTRNY